MDNDNANVCINNIALKVLLTAQFVWLFWYITTMDIFRGAIFLYPLIILFGFFGPLLASIVVIFWDLRDKLGNIIFYLSNFAVLILIMILLYGAESYGYRDVASSLKLMIGFNLMLSLFNFLNFKYLSSRYRARKEVFIVLACVFIFTYVVWNYKMDKAHEQGMTLEIENGASVKDLVNYLYKFGAKKRAIECYKRITHLNSSYSSGLARIYEFDGNYINALKYHKKAITNKQINSPAFGELAELLVKLRYPEKARKYIKIRKKPHNSDRLVISATYIMEKNLEKAIEYVSNYDEQGYSKDKAKILYDKLNNIDLDALNDKEIDRLLQSFLYWYRPINLSKNKKERLELEINTLEL